MPELHSDMGNISAAVDAFEQELSNQYHARQDIGQEMLHREEFQIYASALNGLIEKLEVEMSRTQPSVEDMARLVLISLKTHYKAMDTMYEVVEEIRQLEDKLQIPKQNRRSGFQY
jgi:hypothetical protein